MENKILLKNKSEFIRMLKEESGNISHYILYSILLSLDDNNPAYVSSMMALTSKLAMFSKFTADGLTMSREEYHDAFEFFKSENDIYRFISNDDDINWTIDSVSSKKDEELAAFYFRIYSKTIDYISCLFSQERFIENYLDEYAMAGIINGIFACKGEVPDYDQDKSFYKKDYYYKCYYPKEWKEDFCIPVSFELDMILSCNLDNDIITEIMEKNEKKNKPSE